MHKVALIGRQNTGKTTLFNQLTGSSQRVGNWAGVTVEKKEGVFEIDGQQHPIVDLPGCYSLIETKGMSLDEKIACQYLKHHQDTLFVNVIDASQLKRDLYLTLQLLELGVPMIVAVNRYDLVLAQQVAVDTRFLSELLGCQVVPVSAKTGFGLTHLKQAVKKQLEHCLKPKFQPDYLKTLQKKLAIGRGVLSAKAHTGFNPLGMVTQALEGDTFFLNLCREYNLSNQQRQLETIFKRQMDVYVAYLRHQKIDAI